MQRNIVKRVLIFMMILQYWSISFAQEKTIVKILNRELRREVKNQLKSSNFNGDTILIVKEFSIDKNKNLSFQIKRKSPYIIGTQIIQQEVPLDKILKIGKDIQIILETEKDAVTLKVTYPDGDQKPQTIKESLFFVYFSGEKQNEDLGIELQEAFKKAGYNIAKDNWYD